MKRLVLLVLVLVPVCLFIGGCGSGGDTPTKGPAKTEVEMKDFNKQRMEEMQKVKAAMKK